MAVDNALVDFAMRALGGRTNSDRTKVMQALASNPMLVDQYQKRMSPVPVEDQPMDMNALESTIMRSLDHAEDAPAQAAPKPKAVAKKKAPVNVEQQAASLGRDGQGKGTVPASSDEEGTETAVAPASTDYGSIIKQILGAAGLAAGVGGTAYGAYRYANRQKQMPDGVDDPPERLPSAEHNAFNGLREDQLPATRRMTMPANAVNDPEFQRIAGLLTGPDTIMDADFEEVDDTPKQQKRIGQEKRPQIEDDYSKVQRAIDDSLQEDDGGESRERARNISEEARKAARTSAKKAVKPKAKGKRL